MEDISKNKKIQIKAEQNLSLSIINITLNDTNSCSIDCSLSQNLGEISNLINVNIKDDFSFLDQGGYSITKDNEKLYSVKDILKDGSIRIRGNDSQAATPLNIKNLNQNQNIEKPQKIQKIKNT